MNTEYYISKQDLDRIKMSAEEYAGSIEPGLSGYVAVTSLVSFQAGAVHENKILRQRDSQVILTAFQNINDLNSQITNLETIQRRNAAEIQRLIDEAKDKSDEIDKLISGFERETIRLQTVIEEEKSANRRLTELCDLHKAESDRRLQEMIDGGLLK